MLEGRITISYYAESSVSEQLGWEPDAVVPPVLVLQGVGNNEAKVTIMWHCCNIQQKQRKQTLTHSFRGADLLTQNYPYS